MKKLISFNNNFWPRVVLELFNIWQINIEIVLLNSNKKINENIVWDSNYILQIGCLKTICYFRFIFVHFYRILFDPNGKYCSTSIFYYILMTKAKMEGPVCLLPKILVCTRKKIVLFEKERRHFFCSGKIYERLLNCTVASTSSYPELSNFPSQSWI